MGLSFHYSGRISDPASLPGLIEELEEISKVFQWKYFNFERLMKLLNEKRKGSK